MGVNPWRGERNVLDRSESAKIPSLRTCLPSLTGIKNKG
jgi:hypothetical protein